MTDFTQAVKVLDQSISFEGEGLKFFTDRSTRAPTRFEREIYLELDPPVRESICEASGQKPDEVGWQPLPNFPPANVEFLFDRLHRRLNELTKTDQEREGKQRRSVGWRSARHGIRLYRLVWRVLNALLERLPGRET